MLSAWVSGHLLADLTLEPNELASLLRDLHDALAHVRQHLSPIALRRYNPVEYAQRALAPTQVPDWLKAGADSMLWNPAHEALCHNDLNPWNLIRTPEGEWVTLDWEWLALNDPLFDLAALYQGAGLQPTPSQDARGLEAFARTYSADPISSQRVQACWSAYWLRETAWAAAALHGGANRPEIVSQYELGLEWLRCLWA
jgi:thiamine kinase-like enzyme